MTGNFFSWGPTPSWFAHVFKASFKQHHKEIGRVLGGILASDAVILDVGAHAGQFAKLFANIAPQGMVIAVEPGAYARSVLRLGLYLSRTRNVVVVPAALGTRCDVEVLLLPVKKSGSFGFGLSHLSRQGDGQDEGIAKRFDVREDIVAVVTLDRLAARMGLTRLDFIKVDIEGWELRMIEGGLATITGFRPIILAELFDSHLRRAGDSLLDAWSRLTALGYAANEYTGIPASPFRAIDGAKEGDIWWFPPN